MKNTRIGIIALLTTIVSALWGQPTGASENFYASNGKFYVVIAVIGIIFAGLILFMLLLDQRLGKLEKEISKK